MNRNLVKNITRLPLHVYCRKLNVKQQCSSKGALQRIQTTEAAVLVLTARTARQSVRSDMTQLCFDTNLIPCVQICNSKATVLPTLSDQIVIPLLCSCLIAPTTLLTFITVRLLVNFRDLTFLRLIQCNSNNRMPFSSVLLSIRLLSLGISSE